MVFCISVLVQRVHGTIDTHDPGVLVPGVFKKQKSELSTDANLKRIQIIG